MAGAKALRNKINDEFLTCQICLNIYVEPVLLECQHSFCRSCVSQCLPTISGSLHCPVCRQKTSIPKKLGLATLKKNFFLQSLIDAFTERRNSIASIISNNDVTNVGNASQNDAITNDRVRSSNKKRSRKNKKLCENCEEDKGVAVSRCLDCTDYLCRDCELVHCQTKFTRKHKVVKLCELRNGDYSSEIQARAKVFCSDHPEEICRQICEDCFAPYCHECLTVNHKDHTTRELKDVIAQEKSRLEKVLKNSTEEENNNTENLKKFIKEREHEVSEKKKAIQEIQKRTKAIVAASKSHEDKLIKAIKAVSKLKKNYLTHQEEQCKLKLTAIQNKKENLKLKFDEVMNSGTPIEILTLKTDIDDLESVIETINNTINKPEDTHRWKLCPEVDEATSSSLLVKIKSTLKSLVGYMESEGFNTDLQDFEDVVVGKDFSTTSLSTNSDSPVLKQNNISANDGYCYMQSLLQNDGDNVQTTTSGSSFNTTDDENNEMNGMFQKMNPVPRRRKNITSELIKTSSPGESPSLNMMRKFPPKKHTNKANDELEVAGKKQESFKTRKNGTSEAVAGCSKQENKTKNNVIQWNSRSKSIDRYVDEVIQTESTRGRPKSSLPLEADNNTPVPKQRGRKRHRSLPGAANYSTTRAISTPSGSINSLLSLATSPVAALAEKPARLGIYNTPDPTSNAAVASLAKSIAVSRPNLDNGPTEIYTEVRSSFEQHGTSNVLVKSFQFNGKAITFKSAPKLSCTQNGQIISTDYKAQRLFLFNSDGTLATSIKTKCNGIKSLHPISATSTKKGKLLVACGDAIYKFTANGKFNKKFGSGCFKKCCGIATDPRTGKIVVTDIDKKCVSIHDSEGGLERIFKGGTSPADGIFGSGVSGPNTKNTDLKLETPYFVTVNKINGNIIVSDWANNDVKVFDQDGNYLTSLGLYCSSSHSSHPFSPPAGDEFSNPAGVCCDMDGNIFVADHGKNRVAMFNNNWQFQRFIATDKDGLQTPWSLVAITNKRLCVSEYWSRIIKVFPY